MYLVCGKPCMDCRGEGGQDFSGHYIGCQTCNGSGLQIHNGTKVRKELKFEKQLALNCIFCKVECKQVWEEESEMWEPETETWEPIPPHVSHRCPKCRMSYQRCL